MILVTGATGFVGRVLVRQLNESGQQVRVLLRPSPRSPRLPKGVPVEVAVVSLNDERGLRAALRGVDQIYHLASAAAQGRAGNLFSTDIEGTRTLAQVAAEAEIERFIYLSHLGADRASAFPVHKSKGIAEEHIRKSGVPHTILRSSIVFGPEDGFTTALADILRFSPGIMPIPGDGRTLLQPLWVEDLVTCLIWALQNPDTINQTYEIGGGEYFTLRQVMETIMSVTHFYYQGIERTTVAQNASDESVQLTFTASTKRITDTSGNNRFASLEAGQIMNVSGTVSNDGDKTIVSIAPDGSYCTVVETLVDESTFSAGTIVYIYAGVKLYLHYYRYPTAMTTYNDIPEAIPEALQYPLFVYGITARIYDEIEDGIEGQKVNTTNNENRFKEAILMLVESIPDEGRSFFIGRDVDWRR